MVIKLEYYSTNVILDFTTLHLYSLYRMPYSKVYNLKRSTYYTNSIVQFGVARIVVIRPIVNYTIPQW